MGAPTDIHGMLMQYETARIGKGCLLKRRCTGGSAHLTMLPRAMRHVLRPSKLTLAFARESKGMWISTSEASGTTSGLQAKDDW